MSLDSLLKLAEIEPENPANLYILANAWYFHTNYPEFFSAMRRAVEAGGVPMREMFSREPMFAPIREHSEFREILQSRPAGSP